MHIIVHPSNPCLKSSHSSVPNVLKSYLVPLFFFFFGLMQAIWEQLSFLFISFRSPRGFSLLRGTYVNSLKNLGKSACFEIKPNKLVNLSEGLGLFGVRKWHRCYIFKTESTILLVALVLNGSVILCKLVVDAKRFRSSLVHFFGKSLPLLIYLAIAFCNQLPPIRHNGITWHVI